MILFCPIRARREIRLKMAGDQPRPTLAAQGAAPEKAKAARLSQPLQLPLT
jgi:hypothetical protein